MQWPWAPNTKDDGTEFSMEEIIENSSMCIHNKYCGIYFLLNCDEVVYVGQSIDIKQRIDQHAISGKRGPKHEKVFNRYFFFICQPEELNRLEAYYILKFRPKYNIAIPKESHEHNSSTER